MKGLVLSIVPLVAIVLLVVGCTTSGEDWKEERSVSTFTGLYVSSGIDVYLTQGNSEKLTLEVRGLEKDEVTSEIENGTLKLSIEGRGFDFWNWGGSNYVKAYLTFEQLNSIKASSGAEVVGKGTMSFTNLNLESSGGAEVQLDLKADDVSVSASGGANAVVKGSARTLNASGSGGADLDARELVVESCNANSSGGSDVYVNARNELRMKASGGSDIYYYGSAKVLSRSESGGSDIKRKE